MELETDIEPLGSGNSPLSAKLAAYGENMALKRVEEEWNGDPQVLEDGTLTTQVVFTRDSSRRPCIRDIRALESPGITNQSRGSANQDGLLLLLLLFRIYSAPSAKSALPLANDRAPRAFHQPSHSTSAIEVRTESKDDITIVTTPQPSFFAGHSPPQHQFIYPPLERSRTPDLPGEDPTSAGHVALSRYSSAPPFKSFPDILTAIGRHDPKTR
jgi:hypothetical protein